MVRGLTYRCLQVVAQSVHLCQQEVDVRFRDCGTGDDVAEKVGSVIQRLVADHQRAGGHHPTLEDRRDLEPWWRLVKDNVSVPSGNASMISFYF